MGKKSMSIRKTNGVVTCLKATFRRKFTGYKLCKQQIKHSSPSDNKVVADTVVYGIKNNANGVSSQRKKNDLDFNLTSSSLLRIPFHRVSSS